MTGLYGIQGKNGKELSRMLLIQAVRRHWGWQRLPQLSRSSRGKPEFSGENGKWMSLSHSGGIALCALSDDGPVGVDVELIRPHRQGLPRYVMTEEELESFDGSWEDFCRIWTLKEAFCKKNDTPLFPPREIPVPPACPYASYEGENWRAAVCCCGRPPEHIIWLDPD